MNGLLEIKRLGSAQNVNLPGGIKMNKSEELAKSELIKQGYKVCRSGSRGMPDFQCWNKFKTFYVEVKSSTDGIRINQLKTISDLLQKGERVYLFHYDGKGFETFEITTSLKPITVLEGVSKQVYTKYINPNAKPNAKCNHCGYDWKTKKEVIPKACPKCKQYGKIVEVNHD